MPAIKKSVNLDDKNLDKWLFFTMISWEGKFFSEFIHCCERLVQEENFDGIKDFMVKSFSSLIEVDLKKKTDLRFIKRADCFQHKILSIFEALSKNSPEREFYWQQYKLFLEQSLILLNQKQFLIDTERVRKSYFSEESYAVQKSRLIESILNCQESTIKTYKTLGWFNRVDIVKDVRKLTLQYSSLLTQYKGSI